MYAASAETINPEHEGCMVRVTGPLCTHETLSAGNLGTYSDVIEIQKFATIAYADELQLGKWQVQGLYTGGMTPFFYFAINTPGINWVNVGDTKLAILPSGSEVSLVGRQRGNTLDMADPMSKANLGKPAPVFLTTSTIPRIRTSRCTPTRESPFLPCSPMLAPGCCWQWLCAALCGGA